MSTKSVAVRLFAEGGRQVRAEFEGVGDSGTRSFERIERQADSTTAALNQVMGVLAAAVSVRQIVQYADTWSDLSSRVELATGSQEAGAAVMQRLDEIARRTYSSLEQTAEGYLQNATALRELGMSTGEALDFTEALNNAMVVSGARAQRAEQINRALAQAMALGELRGQQLNTVIQNGGRLAELLAQEMGVTVNQLRSLGAQGLITGDVIRRALIGNLEQLRGEADAMPATIGDAFTLMGNAALSLVGRYDQLLAASESVATALIFLADNLERVASIAIAFAGFMAARWIAAFAAARVATMSLSGALLALRGALIRTGILALVVAAGELIYWFGRLVTATGGFGEALEALGDVARAVWDGMVVSAQSIPLRLSAVWLDMQARFTQALANMARKFSEWMGTFEIFAGLPAVGPLAPLAALGTLAQGSASAVASLTSAAADFTLRAEEARNGADALASYGFGKVREAVQALRDLLTQTGEDAVDLNGDISDSLANVEDALNRTGGAARRTGEALVDAADAAIEGWERVADALRDYADEAMDLAGGIAGGIVGAFRSAENAVGQFVRTGKLSISDLVRSILADFAQIAARRFIFGPLANALSGALGGLGGGPLNAMGAGPLRGFAGGGHTGWGARSGGLDGMGGFLTVMHPQERVVDESGRGRRREGQPVYVTINARDAESFKQSRGQITADIARAVRLGGRHL